MQSPAGGPAVWWGEKILRSCFEEFGGSQALAALVLLPQDSSRSGGKFVSLKLSNSHATMDIFDSASELSRIEEDDEVKHIISNIGRWASGLVPARLPRPPIPPKTPKTQLTADLADPAWWPVGISWV